MATIPPQAGGTSKTHSLPAASTPTSPAAAPPSLGLRQLLPAVLDPATLKQSQNSWERHTDMAGSKGVPTRRL